jgi:hypothetical protein
MLPLWFLYASTKQPQRTQMANLDQPAQSLSTRNSGTGFCSRLRPSVNCAFGGCKFLISRPLQELPRLRNICVAVGRAVAGA